MFSWPRIWIVFVLSWMAMACEETSIDKTQCEPADESDPGFFPRCMLGSGSFGMWIVDPQGLPAFLYTADQQKDPLASWTTTAQESRNDHWFQIGNDRFIAVVTNDGLVQFFKRDRMPTFLNRINFSSDRTGGGYSLIHEEGAVWASAWKFRPEDSTTERLFGMNHVRYHISHHGLSISHQIVAPFGDLPYLLDDVTVSNESGSTRKLSHFEFWDVAQHILEVQYIRSGDINPSIPMVGDKQRDALNAQFTISVALEADAGRVSHVFKGDLSEHPPDLPDPKEYYPADIFLARLIPASSEVPLSLYTDRKKFIGTGSAKKPQAVTEATTPHPLLEPTSAIDEPAVLVDRIDLELAPGETTLLRYAYGYTPQGQSLPDLEPWKDPENNPLEDLVSHTKPLLPLFVCESAPFLHRELAWHAAQLYGAIAYDQYMQTHALVQGSAYMYLHGMDGAARDYALFAVPLAYLRPDVAKELLRLQMRMTYSETDQISYAIGAYGLLENGRVHTSPSDLDLFFLWALSEYLTVTGDWGFLEEDNPFWPRAAGDIGTTRTHAERAFRHLVDQVGTGPHGLIRLGTGDWDDGILLRTKNADLAKEVGESVPNSQMAVWILPRAAGIFNQSNPALAKEMRDYADRMRQEVEEEWNGAWYRRAWFSEGEPYGDSSMQLQAQVWALIGEIPSPERQRQLADEIFSRLDSLSLVGAPNNSEESQLWHAVTSWLTWGYSRVDPQMAWDSLLRHTMTSYASQFPNQWYGTWSGPDALGINGGTWSSAVTPMKDWPVMNANQHALPLLSLLRIAGLEPTPSGDGIQIVPKVPSEKFILDLPILRLEIAPGKISVRYRASVNGHTMLYIGSLKKVSSAKINGMAISPEFKDGFLVVPLTFQAGEEIHFEAVE